jgi:inner membrane protein
MPSEFTHAFVAGVLGKAWASEIKPVRFWVLSLVCSVLPDIDIIGFYYGIKYHDVFGHRGFFHSLTFAFLVSVLVVTLAFPSVQRFSKKWWGLLVYFFVVTASHGFLDAMTDRGLGVGFFIPFDNTRYHMPWRPVYASPMSISKFFSRAGVVVLMAEIIWIWIPLLALYAVLSIYRRMTGRPRSR